MRFSTPRSQGFTLAELLIALVILGVIVAFTIPKLLIYQRDSAYNARAKETVAMISGAYQQYIRAKGPNVNMTLDDLTPYMNYASISAGTFDGTQGYGTAACSNCLLLHNGGVLFQGETFRDTNTTSAAYFYFDPDAKNNSSTTDAPGKAITFWIYYRSGRITTHDGIDLPTCALSQCWSTTQSAHVPPWFSW